MELDEHRIREALCDEEVNDRIDFLLRNKSLVIKTLGYYEFEGKLSPVCSNSFGTVLFILGLEKRFIEHIENKRIGQQHLRGNSIFVENIPSSSKWLPDFSFFPQEFNSPGYLQRRSMRIFCEDLCEQVDKPLPNDIVLLKEPFGYSTIHAGIYLGTLNGKSYVFNQNRKESSFNIQKFGEAFPKFQFKTNFYYRPKSKK